MLFTNTELEGLKGLISACYFDVDDTLQPMGAHDDDSYLRGIRSWRTLVRLSREGRFPPICLVSGRGDAYLESFVFTLGDQKQELPRISEGGALIKRNGKRPEMNPAITQEALETLQEVRARIPDILRACPGFYRYEGKVLCETFERDVNSPMSIAEARVRIEREILADLLTEGIQVGDSSIAVDVVLTDKLTGILKHIELEGLDQERILFGGDSGSDVGPMRFAKYGIAPATHSTTIAQAVQEKQYRGLPAEPLGSCTEETAVALVTLLKSRIRTFVLDGRA